MLTTGEVGEVGFFAGVGYMIENCHQNIYNIGAPPHSVALTTCHTVL